MLLCVNTFILPIHLSQQCGLYCFLSSVPCCESFSKSVGFFLYHPTIWMWRRDQEALGNYFTKLLFFIVRPNLVVCRMALGPQVIMMAICYFVPAEVWGSPILSLHLVLASSSLWMSGVIMNSSYTFFQVLLALEPCLSCRRLMRCCIPKAGINSPLAATPTSSQPLFSVSTDFMKIPC